MSSLLGTRSVYAGTCLQDAAHGQQTSQRFCKSMGSIGRELLEGGESSWISLALGGGWQSRRDPCLAAQSVKPPRFPRLRDICHPGRVSR